MLKTGGGGGPAEPMDKMSEGIIDLLPNQFAAVENEFDEDYILEKGGDHTSMRLLSQDVACFGIQRGDFRLSGSPSGQGVVAGTQTRDRKVPPDLRTDLLVTLAETALTT
ncbi:hypothetical protein PoB_001553600 [Plakobranchus ocellatus]|uniref:Uncharacterized protein n=1 Tax=Plakobranchus ocellatus TaxID=259542 RepID=A0AAV3YPG7_9GAST|nr:hypothetical protein PoB_001553600 [Plakobranchus ocellatus]